MIEEDEKFDEILKSRKFEPESDDLSVRIVNASKQIPQNKKITVSILIDYIAYNIILPRPAFALPIVLAMGLFLGINSPVEQATNEDYNFAEEIYFEDYLYE